MRRFAGFLCAAFILALVLGGFSRAEGRDDPKEKPKYDCEICDNEAYEVTANRALLYVHVAGVDASRKEHRARKFKVNGGTAFVFREMPKSPSRICTAWHVIRDMEHWNGPLLAMYPWNMRGVVIVRVACYNEELDLVVLDFADSAYEYTGSTLDLGDDEKLKKGDEVSAMGAPYGHTFMRSSGEFRAYGEGEGGAVQLIHSAATAPGMSGGPVLDKTGRLVGVNVAMFKEGDPNHPRSISATVGDLKRLLEAERTLNDEGQK
ncbi:MAG: trypsin-like peptidase domain-containing protein [Candidatus Harrisonbacteria bacterium]|nr:trypsin-like peptidase domain-containing protein [Candidatus Harrisonbacteria bacterium]